MEKKAVLIIEGMHCGHCAQSVSEGLKKAKGVKEAEAVYTTGKARVIYDEDVAKPEDFVKIVQDLGYSVKEVK